jgi:hypothetical protein
MKGISSRMDRRVASPTDGHSQSKQYSTLVSDKRRGCIGATLPRV